MIATLSAVAFADLHCGQLSLDPSIAFCLACCPATVSATTVIILNQYCIWSACTLSNFTYHVYQWPPSLYLHVTKSILHSNSGQPEPTFALLHCRQKLTHILMLRTVICVHAPHT